MNDPGPASPFPGARPYRAGEELPSPRRAAQARDVAVLWRSRRVTIVHGPAGSGRTSLLEAAVRPLLEGGAHRAPLLGAVLPDRPFPTAALPAHEPFEFALLRGWAPTTWPTALGGTTVRDWLRDRCAESPRPVLAGIDQADDLFQRLTAAQRERLMAGLRGALGDNPSLRLLFSVRTGRLGALRDAVGPADTTEYRLGGLEAADARAVLEPLTTVPAGLPPAAADAVVDDLMTIRTTDEDGRAVTRRAETVHTWSLQQASLQLWRSRRMRGRLARSGRDARTVVDQALGAALWRVVSRVAELFDRDPGWLGRALAEALVAPSGAGRDADAHDSGVPEEILRALQDRQVLDGDGRRFRPAADRLAAPLALLATGVDRPAPSPASPSEQLRAALAAGPDRALTLAESALAAGRGDSATEMDARILLGDLAFAAGERETAERHYRAAALAAEVRRDVPMVGALLAAIGRIHRLGGDPGGALGLLKSASARLPGDRAVQAELARAFVASGQPRAAAALLGGPLDQR
ncbi:tetratricopeptide repeat protein [Thermomonospora umbrina]|uniref:Novel STAND NTPase 1 domain-containing protein n=1 Tax=Thermomonospora umbrina TaxID=111806 RepID=A0A3D9SNT4_9ACTN|nr:tetratricopeptide repeat protein [Thermomonospora umbrina]REE95623.1 hypothetical protein DFJ69_1027 [Thermomonospora umbrina]